MKRVVIVAPEFPPANTAAVHRSRIFATHLPPFGWEPTVLTVKENQIEGPLDRDLDKLIRPETRVIRTSAIPVHPWRFLGDMGLRCLWHHKRALEKICKETQVDLIFIPGPPWFMFLLGLHFLERYGIPYVIDYIDPWISEWSMEAKFPSKRWIYNRLANRFESKVLERASHVTAVSEGIHDDLRQRYPFLPLRHCTAMPYGGDAHDFEVLRQLHIQPPDFHPGNGEFTICFTGALQPRGFEILRVLLMAVKLVKRNRPDLFKKLKLRFYGTSNLTWGYGRYQVMPIAKQFGLEEKVSEIPERVPYLQSLAIQAASSANLIMGSSERYYHASKLYTSLLAGKPLLAICHREASIAKVLSDLGIRSSVTFDDLGELFGRTQDIFEMIVKLSESAFKLPDIPWGQFERFSAGGVTQTLAKIFDQAAEQTALRKN